MALCIDLKKIKYTLTFCLICAIYFYTVEPKTNVKLEQSQEISSFLWQIDSKNSKLWNSKIRLASKSFRVVSKINAESSVQLTVYLSQLETRNDSGVVTLECQNILVSFSGVCICVTTKLIAKSIDFILIDTKKQKIIVRQNLQQKTKTMAKSETQAKGLDLQAAQEILREEISGVLADSQFDAHKVQQWCQRIVTNVLKKLVEANKNQDIQYKYVVNTFVLEKTGAGLHSTSSCLWDKLSDSSTSYQWNNDHIKYQPHSQMQRCDDKIVSFNILSRGFLSGCLNEHVG
ncbi:cytoplasmic dynein light chain [Reticulomyxa filosa]|uniref:Cytoplasmic dynein light chain n=1 Tax=Reticulomyxa filosa TaxID=46433 RepID=X6MB07_RETFI|nr:cytoplasmic dynein light chain [Reticulomyxa filosa]|eukprot:ETO11039.1 cytoplasmic dynein light chain [Reticulomyxa filosa]